MRVCGSSLYLEELPSTGRGWLCGPHTVCYFFLIAFESTRRSYLIKLEQLPGFNARLPSIPLSLLDLFSGASIQIKRMLY